MQHALLSLVIATNFFLAELMAVVLVVDHMDLRQYSGVSEFIEVGLDEIAIDAAILGNTVSKLLLTL